MPNKNHLLFILPIAAILLLPLLISSCKQPDETSPPQLPKQTFCDTCLPPITTTGKKTFGCKVNGKVWLPKRGWTKPDMYADYYNNELIIYGYNDITTERLGFSIKPIADTATFTFPNGHLESGVGAYSLIRDSRVIQFVSNPLNRGKIEILRFDLERGIFSGTFEFDVYDEYNQSNGDTIHITEGRFDIIK